MNEEEIKAKRIPISQIKDDSSIKGNMLIYCKYLKSKPIITKIKEIKSTIFGQFESASTCHTCHGKGKVPKVKCSVCKGHGIYRKPTEIIVKIPAGINPGEMIRLSGAGEAIEGGKSGDLYIRLHIKKHPVFTKVDHNLVMNKKIKLTDAILGTSYDITTLDGVISLKIPEGIQHGEILKIKGKGVPYDGSKRGDILVNIMIDIPHKLSKSAKKAIEELRTEGL